MPRLMEGAKLRILVAEDDKSIASVLKRRLEAAHYSVDVCHDGGAAYDLLRLTDYDVAIMDIMMPVEDGLSAVCRAREAGVRTPVLFLTARDAVADRVEGLDAGGDDYLVKPFALDEVMARVRALSRRGRSEGSAVLTLGDLSVDTSAQRVTRAGKPIALTGREYALLEYLMRNQGAVLSRERIEQNIFSYDYEGASNMVDVYIRYLRRKIDEGFSPRLIHTVRGAGYVLREEA